MMKIFDAPKKPEAGQGFVELAITIVLLLIIIAGIVDVGRAVLVLLTLRDAAQEGVVYGSFCPLDTQGIEDRVRNSTSDPINMGDTSAVQVTSTCSFNNGASQVPPVPNCQAGTGITVVVTFKDFTISMPFIGAILGFQKFDLSATETDVVITNTTACPPI